MAARLAVLHPLPSGAGLRLRAVRDADGPGLTRLVADAYHEFACGPLDPGGFDADLAAPADYAERRGRRWWVVTAEDVELVASVATSGPYPAPDRGRAGANVMELHRLYLAPQVRGRGLASVLVAGVAEEAALLGADRLIAWSDTRLVAAHARYLALGFALTPASRELDDPAGTTEVRFDLPLRT
jgi:GNAT superfamily N-acetyltransferase